MCSVQPGGTTSGGTPGTLTWLDPTTLQVLYQETIIAALLGPSVVPVGEINGTGFAPTPTPAASTATPFLDSPGGGCGGWQLSADQTSIAGINVVGNSAVPATFNLATGAITNVVKPPSTSGFTATTPVTYIGAFYAPDGHSVWSLQCDGADDVLTVHAPDGKVEATIPSTITDGGGVPLCDKATMSDSYLVWLPGASTPTIVIADSPSSGPPYPYNLAVLSRTPGGTDSPLSAAQAASLPLVDQSLLPRSNWIFGYIHRSPDGSRAAFIATRRDGRVQIWDIATGKELALEVRLDASWLNIRRMARRLKIRDFRRWQLATFRGHRNDKNTMAVAPDGSWLAAGSIDGRMRIWDLATGRERVVFGYQDREIAAVAPDGSWLATRVRNDGSVWIWDTATGNQRAVLGDEQTEVTAVAAAPDGSWLAISSRDGRVRIWDTTSRQQRAVLSGHQGAVTTLAVAPDGTWLATGSTDGRVRIWDTDSERRGALLDDHQVGVKALAVKPDGSWLAAGSIDDRIRIWDVPRRRQFAVLGGNQGAVNTVAVPPDGSWLATGSTNGALRKWDIVTEQQLTAITCDATISSVAVSSAGNWLAAADSHGRVWIWDTKSEHEHAVLGNGHGAVNAVAISPDGNWLAAGGTDGAVRIWDTNNRWQRTVLQGHHGAVNAVAISPDGNWLAAGGTDGAVRIWDTNNRWQRTVLQGHHGAVNAVAISSDGNWLAAGGTDGAVRICDTATGKSQAFMRVDGPIFACAWLGAERLFAGGPAGLYMFDFLTDTGPASRSPIKRLAESSELETT
jgi:WD40 repeat protein